MKASELLKSIIDLRSHLAVNYEAEHVFTRTFSPPSEVHWENKDKHTVPRTSSFQKKTQS